MKKFDRNEIIGKTVKDLEKLDWQDHGSTFPQKKYWLLALSVVLFAVLVSGSVWWLKSRTAGLASGITPQPDEAEQTGAVVAPLQEAEQTGAADAPLLEAEQTGAADAPLDEAEPPVTEFDAPPVQPGGQGQTPPAGDFIEHEIQAGDCLGTISLQYYGTSVHAAALAHYNQLPVDAVLQIGQIIRVPQQAGQLQP